MASSLNASTSGSGGVIVTSDATGNLDIQSGGSTVVAVTSTGVAVTGTLAASGAVTLTGSLNAPNTFGFKNRIINGGMVIDQRNAGASVTPTDGAYTLDRWRAGLSQVSKLSIQQNSGAVTPPSGFKNYLGVVSLSAYALTGSDVFMLQQKIEGYNVSDLMLGTASAATFTVSFWVRSSLTGLFGGSLINSAGDRSYPFSYTISIANTWEQKSITVAGDTSGTWLTTTGSGLELRLSMGSSGTYLGTVNTWGAGNYASVTGATSVVGTNGATFYITGVQLEKGSTATSFDFRDYGRELIMCQRYLPAWSGLNSLGTGQSIGSTNCRFNLPLPVTARVSPTGVSVSSAAHFATNNSAGTNLTGTAVTFLNAGTLSAWFDISVASGLTAGNASQVFATSSSALLYLTGCEL